jgi:hypothetical protein
MQEPSHIIPTFIQFPSIKLQGKHSRNFNPQIGGGWGGEGVRGLQLGFKKCSEKVWGLSGRGEGGASDAVPSVVQ